MSLIDLKNMPEYPYGVSAHWYHTRVARNDMNKKILIVGDAGRGKSTFAKNLSEKTGIPAYSTDDFFWKTKYTEPRDRPESVEMINRIYENDEWIVEGSTRRLIQPSLEEMLKPYEEKVIRVSSYKQADERLESFRI